MPEASALLTLRHASVTLAGRQLWHDLNLTVAPGEFLTILGPNGSGKTTLLRAILGLQPLTSGTILLDEKPVRPGLPDVSYIPQHHHLDPDLPLRGEDLVRQGLTGHHWGLSSPRTRRTHQDRIATALEQVQATHLAHHRIGTLSGGEQQRLRAAQALVSQPRLLLCDEPLLSLDLAQQRNLVHVIAQQCHTHNTAVLFVTHEINPVLPYTDRILYLTDTAHRTGTVAEVMNSATLSELYGSPITVATVTGRIVVVGTEGGDH